MTITPISDYALPTPADLTEDKVSWPLDTDKAVLLIHDMQDYFVDFYGQGNAAITGCIDAIARLKQHCKAQGVPVVYTAQPPEQSDADRGLLNDMWGAGLTRRPEKAGIVAPLAPDGDDRVLTKWRYSAFFRAPLTDILEETGRDQLVICGIYGHIGVLQTAVDAFMRGIKPFLVADAICDFSREEHMMALRYVARRAGRTLHSQDILEPADAPPLTKDALRQRVAGFLDEVPEDTDNLIDFGLDSIAVMQLISEWKQAGLSIDFVELGNVPTLDGWWALVQDKLARKAA